MAVRDAPALLHRVDGTELAVNHDEGREHEHKRENDAGHDQQDDAGNDREHQQNGGAKKFQEWARMPQGRKIDRIGIIVRGEIECRGTHVDERAAY